MRFIKIDPITGEKVATGACPAGEPPPVTDHEGLLVFVIEGEPQEYQFDHGSMGLVRADASPLVELRQRLVAEKRRPTEQELAAIAVTPSTV